MNRVGNDEDYYSFRLTRARTMRFELRSLSANADLFLEDASGRQLGASRNARTAIDSVVHSLDAGTYYIRVDAVESGTVRYQLRYGHDAGTTPRTAINLDNLANVTATRQQSGTVNRHSNDKDYYRFTLSRARRMRFELRNLTADADLYLEDVSGRELRVSNRSGTASDSIIASLAAGTYYLRVDASGSGTIRYQLRYAHDRGSTSHSALNLGDMTNLAMAGTRSGSVDGNDTLESNDDNYYRFTLTAARAIRFELRSLTANADLYLEDASGRQLHSSENAGTAVDSILASLNPGTWYVRVDASASGTIHYQLRYDSDEGGSTRQSAFSLGDLTNLAAAGTRSGTVETGSDDYYRFTLAAARVMRIELRNLTANADLYLEDGAGRQLESSTNARIAVDSVLVPLNAGTYYIRVNASEAGNIEYQLRYSRDEGSTPQSAVNLGDLTRATEVGTRSGTVDRDGNARDYFRFTLTAAQGMRIELRNLTADADLYLEDASGRQLHSSVNSGTSVDWILASLAAGTYYIRVNVSDSGTIGYQIRYVRDAGWSLQTAIDLGDLTNVSTARTQSDTMHTVINNRDYFRFTLSARSNMWFGTHTVAPGGTLHFSLLNASGRTFRSEFGDVTASLNAGTYYIAASLYRSRQTSGTIGYQFRYSQIRERGAGGRNTATATDLGALTVSPQGLSGRVPARNFRRPAGVDALYPSDNYRFTLRVANTVRLRDLGSSRWIDWSLRHASGQEVDGGNDFYNVRLNAGTYFIRITSRNDNGAYYRFIVSTANRVSNSLAAGATFLTAGRQPLWRGDTMSTIGALRPDHKRQLQGAGRDALRMNPPHLHSRTRVGPQQWLVSDADRFASSTAARRRGAVPERTRNAPTQSTILPTTRSQPLPSTNARTAALSDTRATSPLAQPEPEVDNL